MSAELQAWVTCADEPVSQRDQRGDRRLVSRSPECRGHRSLLRPVPLSESVEPSSSAFEARSRPAHKSHARSGASTSPTCGTWERYGDRRLGPERPRAFRIPWRGMPAGLSGGRGRPAPGGLALCRVGVTGMERAEIRMRWRPSSPPHPGGCATSPDASATYAIAFALAALSATNVESKVNEVFSTGQKYSGCH